MNEWPRLDPLTNRKICQNCWDGIHYHKLVKVLKDSKGNQVPIYESRSSLTGADHACNGECDCVHRAEETWAAIEQMKEKNNRRELRKNLKAQLEDPTNPLLAVNDSFKPKGKKVHA